MLEKTNAQGKISPTAIALSQTHHSGKKRGGNCTPEEYNYLERKKHEYCNESGTISCDKGNPSIKELGHRAELAQKSILNALLVEMKDIE